MNEPPTLILREGDEERTLVDRAKLSGPEQAFAGSGHSALHQAQNRSGGGPELASPQSSRARRSLLSNHRREIVELSVALALLVGLGSVRHQQWRTAENMREALADIRATSLDMAVVRSEALPSMRETHSERDIERQPFDKELAGGEREALESQAAALIASNDFRSALSRYQALSALYPDDETLRDVIVVLRAKLRCDPSADFGSGACR